MSNFKKGDLVEVVGLVAYTELLGKRFTLKNVSKTVYDLKSRQKVDGLFWKSPFKDGLGGMYSFKEEHLRKVNPEGNKLSEFSFDELMVTLKSPKREKNNVYPK